MSYCRFSVSCVSCGRSALYARAMGRGFLDSVLDALRGRRDGADVPIAEPGSPYRAPGHRGPAPADATGAVDARRLPLPLAEPPSAPRTAERESAWIAPMVGEMMVHLGAALRPGVAVREIESMAHGLLDERGLRSSMKGFNAFPSAVAVSIDDEVMHAIDGGRIIPDGSLVKLQFGARGERGGVAQMGWTFAVGDVRPEMAALRSATMEALRAGLAVLRESARTGDLGAAIQTTLEAAGFNAVRDYVGYAFGDRPMMDPQLKGYGKAGLGPRFHAGMLLHVHAIAAAGDYEVEIGQDKWTVRTKDRRPAALATALVRVTTTGAEMLAPLVTAT